MPPLRRAIILNFMPLTLKDIAELSAVSASTVSRVLSGDPRISATTTKRVNAVLEQTGYRMNSVARSLKTNRTMTVGFSAPDIANDFFMTLALGVETRLSEAGYSLIICNNSESREKERRNIQLFLQKCVDGIICIPVSRDGSDLRKAQEEGTPSVLVDRLTDGGDSDAVLSDNIAGSYEAINYLLNTGVRRLGFIGGDMALTSARERYSGYEKAMAEHGIKPDKRLIRFGDFHMQSGYKLMKSLMELIPPPEHVFIANHYMSIGAVKYLIESEYDRTLGAYVSTFDDMGIIPYLGFTKVTVAQPMEEIGRQAAELLLKRMRGAATESGIIKQEIRRLPTTLHIY